MHNCSSIFFLLEAFRSRQTQRSEHEASGMPYEHRLGIAPSLNGISERLIRVNLRFHVAFSIAG